MPNNLQINETPFVADTKELTKNIRMTTGHFTYLASLLGIEANEEGKFRRGTAVAIGKAVDAIVESLIEDGKADLTVGEVEVED